MRCGPCVWADGEWTSLDPAVVEYDVTTGEFDVSGASAGVCRTTKRRSPTQQDGRRCRRREVCCAQIVRNAQATPALNVRASGIDRMRMEYFSDSLLDESVRKLLGALCRAEGRVSMNGKERQPAMVRGRECHDARLRWSDGEVKDRIDGSKGLERELGITATAYEEVELSPVVLRNLQAKEDDSRWRCWCRRAPLTR